jgi:hypothetical protein
MAALAAGAVAAPALAQSDDLLECTTQAVTPAFRDKLADAMLSEDPGADALFEQLVAVSDDCARRHNLAEAKGEAYYTYSVARLPHDAFIVRLGQAGIPTQVVDEALDFGEGRSNPVITGNLSKPQLERLLAALSGAGVAVDAVTDRNWAMVGAYAATTSLMWQNRIKLK